MMQGTSDISKAPAPSPNQYDWNSFMSSFATQAAKYLNQETTPQPMTAPAQHIHYPPPPLQPPVRPLAPLRPVASAERAPPAPPLVSPDAESDSQSVFETAKGLAMISLEAAAEPHYVGESSGSLWTTVISKGMHAPRTGRAAREPSEKPSRSPSPARLTALRGQLARPLPQDLATLVLDTVFRHLHSRVSQIAHTDRFVRYRLNSSVSVHGLASVRNHMGRT